ncbi:unnamed protein product, partial [Candidula unifasciata]
HNLPPAVGRQSDKLCKEVVTQSTVPEYSSLSSELDDSNSHEFWHGRNNNNWECFRRERDDNGDSNNNIDDNNNNNNNRELPRQLMHVAAERALSPQTPPTETVRDHLCSQQLSLERSGTMDGSVDDQLKMFLLHLDMSALHDNIDDADSMTVSQQKPSAQRDYGCHNLRECNNLCVNDTTVTEAPLSPSAYHNSGIFRASSNTDEPPLPPVQQDLYKKYSEDECSYQTKQLAMKIQGLKKKIKRFEESFEMDYGYKPSQAEKASQPHIKKYMSKLARARKDLKRLKENAENGNRSKNGHNGSPFDARHPMAMSVDFIVRSFGEKRQSAGKTENNRVSAVLELQTVPENEMMEIPVSFSRDPIQDADYLHEGDTEPLDDVIAEQEIPAYSNLDVTDAHLKQEVQNWNDCSFRALDTGGDSRLHEMSLPELWRELEFAKVQKGRFGRAIREFEHDFFVKTGRKVRKENRFPLQSEYSEYKKVKGRLRLLEALILKHCE